MGLKEKYSELSQLIIGGKHTDAEMLTSELLKTDISAKEILDEALMPGMAVVGRRFRDQEIFVPHVLVAARAMKFCMKVLEPAIVGEGISFKGKIILGTVKGDVHDIGKNLVGIMLQGAGYEVIDIGTGCSDEKFLSEFENHSPEVIGMSALLTTTMPYMKTVIDKFSASGIETKFIVGGAPLNEAFARDIGADGYGKSAYEAVGLVDSLFKID